MYVTL